MVPNVTYNADLQMVEVFSPGNLSEEDILGQRLQIERLILKHRAARVLVDTTALISLPATMALYDFVNTFAETKIPRRVRFALLSGVSSARDVRFLETLSINRGYLVRAFNTREEALAWLLQKT